MQKKWYVFVIPIFILIFSFTNAEAAETYVSGSGSAGTGETITAGAYSHTGIYPDGRELYEFDANHYDWINTWNITQNVRITGLTVGKYYNGMIKITYSNSVPTGINYRLAEIQTTDLGTGLKCFVYGTGTVNIDIIFDNYYATEIQIGLPTISQLFYDFGAYQNSSINISVSVSCTATNLISSSIPTDTGLAGVIEYMLVNSIEGSTALGEIYNVLDTIRQNNTAYLTDVISRLATSNSYLSSLQILSTDILSRLTNINTTTSTILNDLEAYIQFMQLHIPYLDNIATNTLNTYNQLVTILNYLKNRPTHSYIAESGNLYYFNGMTTKTTSNNRFVINKDDNIEYVYVKNTLDDDYYPVILYFEEYIDGIPNNYPTRVVYNHNITSYDYITIDFKYNEKFAVINTTDASGFKAYIGDGYTYNAIMYWIQRSMEMNADESSEAAAVESAYAERDSQSANLLTGMDGLTFPTVDANNFDILGSVDNTQKINFFGLIGTITNNGFITTMLLIIVTGAIVGFILYGKK